MAGSQADLGSDFRKFLESRYPEDFLIARLYGFDLQVLSELGTSGRRPLDDSVAFGLDSDLVVHAVAAVFVFLGKRMVEDAYEVTKQRLKETVARSRGELIREAEERLPSAKDRQQRAEEIVNVLEKFLETASPRKLLLVFANPRSTVGLRLGEEDRVITETIRLSRHSRSIDLVKLHAATIDDLHRALLRENPEIVHISGHGTDEGLLLETPAGESDRVSPEALAELFAQHSPPRGGLKCVVFSACYALEQGRLAARGVETTIAMEGPLGDTAAIEFARGFYDAAGAGYTYDRAYDEGCVRVKLKIPDGVWRAVLFQGGEIHRLDGPASSWRDTDSGPS